MRSVSFVEHLEFEFAGNILQNAIVLGDVNNDGGSELVVANVAGDLAIFKGESIKPWRQYRGLGMVSCIVIGDICNDHQNVVLCITSEGWCHLMNFADLDEQDSDEDIAEKKSDVVSIYHQSLPTNGKIALINDVDGDGVNELVMASTDRVVRVFKWIEELPKKETRDVQTKDKTLVKQNSKEGKGSIQKQNSKEGRGLFRQTPSHDHDDLKASSETAAGNASTSSQSTSQNPTLFSGKFVCVKRWKLPSQIESLSVVRGRGGTCPAILVSQPGGGYVYVVCDEESVRDNLQKQIKQLRLQTRDSAISFADCHSSSENLRVQHPLPRRTDMSSIPTNAVSWSWRPARGSSLPTNYIAMCTLNGTLAVIKDEKMHWSINLNHNFFTVQKLDITGDGANEVAFCAWDGETYIMDRYENIVNFKLGEDISAFCAGTYALNEHKGSLPCLVYVTFNNRIRLYWNVAMRQLETRNFNDTVVAKLGQFNLDPKYLEFIVSEDGYIDNDKIKQLTSWCLYGRNGTAKQGGTSDCSGAIP